MRSNMVESQGQSVGAIYSGFFLGAGVFLQDVAETIATTQPSFDKFKDLYADTPLRFPRSLSTENIEDETDVNEALDSLNEHGSISIEDLKKKLGL